MTPPSRAEQTGLLERDAELGELAERIEHARDGRGALIQIEGPAGIGKTTLVSAACELARRRGFRVLRARGAPLEREFALGVARGLYERELAELGTAQRDEYLPGSAALATRALGLASGVVPAAEDSSIAVIHGLYWLTANFAAERPLLLAVDDAHWADRASLRFLAYLAPRVEELPLALVVASRPREPGAERVLVDELATSPGGALIHPQPLTIDATRAVLARRLETTVDHAFAEACHTATGGNPFLLHELAIVLRTEGSGATSAEVARVAGLGPQTVSRSLLLRLAKMPPGAGSLARALAILGDEADFHHAAALARIEPDDAGIAADALADAEIIARTRPLRFVHAIVRSAVEAEIGPGERSTAHLRAADLLAASGAAPQRIASHILHATPAGRDDFVDVLRSAADEALERGAAHEAASYLARALRETPTARADGRMLHELGRAEYLAGADPGAAVMHLGEALALIAEPEQRVAVWVSLARATMVYVSLLDGILVLEDALADLTELDPGMRLRIETEVAALGMTHAAHFELSAARVDAFPEVAGTTPTERLILACQAFRTVHGYADREQSIELAHKALAGGDLVADEGVESEAVLQVLWSLAAAGLVDEARAHVDLGLKQVVERGSAWGFAVGSGLRAWLEYVSGDLAACEADCRQAIDAPGSPRFTDPYLHGLLAVAFAERGDLDGAAELLATPGLEPEPMTAVHMDFLLWARGHVRLVEGRTAEAADDLLEFARRSYRVGDQMALPWRADAAVACLLEGDVSRAREFADEDLQRARQWGTSAAIGIALRAQGLVQGGERGLELLSQAEATLSESGARLEHARAVVDLGSALRRAGQRKAARDQLRSGLDAARRCGATALAKRAYEELVTAGARPRRLMFSGVEALTASERRVAQMAAQGMTNREIAQALFVTAKTVENHLGRVYSKLDISSRKDLAAALDGGVAA